MSDRTTSGFPSRRRTSSPPGTNLPSEFGSLPDTPPPPPLAPPIPPTSDSTESMVPPLPDEVPPPPAPASDEAEPDRDDTNPGLPEPGLSDPDRAEADATPDSPPAPDGDEQRPAPPAWGSGPGWDDRSDSPAVPNWGSKAVPEYDPDLDWDEGLDDPPPFVAPRKRIWPWFLALFILIAPFGIMGACTAFLVARSRAPVDATNEFIAALDEGRVDDAYDQLCDPTKQEVSFEAFAADYDRSEEITDYAFSSLSAPSQGMTLVSGKINLAGNPWATTFHVLRDNGDWQVCQYEPLPSQEVLVPTS